MCTLKMRYVESKIYSNTDHYGKFIFQPLRVGQGITIGNALRRILLSDLEGTAITSARISGSTHEFSEVPGVREDVLEILLNLKEVVLRSHTNETGKATLRVQGPCVVTASDFEFPSFVEAVDPDQYIATISDSNILEIEISICTGRGYQLANAKSLHSNIDSLQLDAVFMPVTKVNFIVEEINTDSPMTEEKLIIEIWTNGSLCPQESLIKATTMLIETLDSIKDIRLTEEEDPTLEEQSEVKNFPIESLKLSVRAYNCLKNIPIDFTEDLLNYSQEDLLAIKNFGKKCCEEVNQALEKLLGRTLPKRKF